VNIVSDPEAAVESIARGIRESLDIHGVVVHPRTSAAACWLEGGREISTWFPGPKIDDPRILTGGGDHFNAGFCLGWLAGLTIEEALCVGTATSGYYVGTAASPTRDELIGFISSTPEPAV
jgi:sugar/nucleoside kinase (ribokinase family)